ncbi:piezo-type mechanosensitive ion channel component 2-like [Scleropages formosus]|uniref:Piezo-type mechanosensitive ion channel component 2-like n=1 Tax=Scleropages formosus TaxID=113540 RepID=A0A0P7UTT6_SCLFO|nr:piezo-type mechanosensitive ion channel component 2-like [Scleropages formosus]
MASLSTWLVCRSLVQTPLTEDLAQYNMDFEAEEPEESTKMRILRRIAGVASKVKEIIGNLITTAGQVVVTILLGLTGIMLPSLTSAVYFFVFLGLCTWWSLCRTFEPLVFSCLCVLMAIYSAGHLIVLYMYQLQFFQEAVPAGDSYASLFGISPIIRSDCLYTWKLLVHDGLRWHHFVNPIMLLVLYYTLATLIRLWLQDPIDTASEEGEASELEEPEESDADNTAQGKRKRWMKAHYTTEERKVLVVTSNGTSLDYIPSSLPCENGPTTLDLYSTPQYKVDLREEEAAEEKKDGSVCEVSDAQEVASVVTEVDENTKSSTLATIFKFIMKQSYICALIAMMAWSITYVSWLTFVFLIWSCTLWMMRDRRKYAMLTSPFMVMYGNLMIILQYIWSFEQIKGIAGLFLKQDVPFPELGSKILFLLTFWLLLRQFLTERQERLKQDTELLDVKGWKFISFIIEEEHDKEEEGDKEIMQVLGNMVMAMFVKYWIYICGGMFFFVSFEGRTVLYKIIYMMMLLFCVALYQVHYEWWRRILKYFWMSVVVYTMLVLTLVYTFQFETSPHVWSNMTGLTINELKDLGLERFSVRELFIRIFIPTSFLLVCILHLHYFHDRFLQLTDLKAVQAKQESTIYRLAHPDGSLADIAMISSPAGIDMKEQEEKALLDEGMEKSKQKEALETPGKAESRHLSEGTEEPPSEQSSDLKNKWHLVVDRLTVLFLKFLEYFHKLQVFIWWLLEMHIIKIVSSYIILVCINEVTLFNYVFLASWAFALPFSQFRPLASSVCTVWTCVIIACKMLYQLDVIEPKVYSSNCSMPDYTIDQKNKMQKSLLYSDLIDPSNWVGLQKYGKLLGSLRNNFLMLAILAFEVTIYRHQEYYRLRNNLIPPVARIIFHDITRQHLDDGIISCAKYFINYFFYKFGVETCFLLAVNVIGQRMDFYAMLHAFSLIAVMYRRRRKAIAEVWPKYCCFLACMLTFQYFVCIGIPPAACKDYPWRFPNSTMNSDVVKWLYFPDFLTKPNPMFLAYDFMLLLCASLQRQVFEDENKAAMRIMAGDNVEICRDLDAASFSLHNPVPDFIYCRSYLDMLKVIVFSYLFWFVLTIIFITGTTRISIFCMGYLVACFYFLLFGGNLLLKPIKKILHFWDFLIAYNVFVITMKNVLSIAACGFIIPLVKNNCWVVQLFSLACTIKGYSEPPKDRCELPKGEAGIIWDSICFAFLLLQRRVFMSYYFLHVVADIRSSQILASRGAELFQATIVKAVKARIEEEKKSMDQLKRQMDRIKTRQQKFKKGKEKMLSMAQESGEGQKFVQEEDDEEAEKAKGKKKAWWRPWVDHASMVRSGDYYLFETDSEDEEEEEDEKKQEAPPKKSAFQFVYHAWIADSKIALKERSKEKRKFWKRYTGRGRARKDKKEDHVAIEVDDLGEDGTEEDSKKSDGPGWCRDIIPKSCWFCSGSQQCSCEMIPLRCVPTDNIIKRIFNIIKFTWILFLTTLESFTAWLNSMCREHIDISTVLRMERCMLTREVKKGNVPSRESIHVYYQKQMRMNVSRESGLDQIEEEDSTCNSQSAMLKQYKMESQDSMASRDSISSAYTEATMLFSRQSTLDDLDATSESIPKTSERARPKLRKMYSMEISTSSADSGSSIVDECMAQSYTPDTDAPATCTDATYPTDADVPPSYSKAVSFDHISVSSDEDGDRRLMVMTPDESRSDYMDDIPLPSLTHELTASELLLNKMFHDEELEASERFYQGQPQLLQLCYALYNMLVARSEMVCYLVIILNHMISASMATLVLPILIFLWAMLSVPRPSKRFWMTAIVYTEVGIVIKYFFQFGFFPFNQNISVDKSKPYHPPNIIGIEKKDGYVHYDLVQLLALFFHRSILKCHGLWDDDDPNKPQKGHLHREDSEDEAQMASEIQERKGSDHSLKSVNLAASLESVHVRFPESQAHQRRKSSTASSHISRRSSYSTRSKRVIQHIGKVVTSFTKHYNRGTCLTVMMSCHTLLLSLLLNYLLRRKGPSMQNGGHRSQHCDTSRSISLFLTGSTSTHNSSRRTGSESGVQPKRRKELLMDKLQEQFIRAKAFTIKKALEIYLPIRQFFYNLIHPEYSAVTDVYVLMFLADTVDFIIIVFGFWAFGKHSAAADITSSLSEDQVPEAFLVMVLIQFSTMVVDRALYLRKTVLGKVIFQVILVFGIHTWMFFILPGVTQRRFNQNTVAQLWYFVKCIYFGLSAYQIRCGYPTRVLGNFLTKSYNYLNLFFFQGFRLVPFLTELRAVMDWVWTDTTLSLSSWICVEDIYAHIFVLKCWRESEKRYPQPRGQKKKKVVKYGMGGMIVVLLICIVWFPLLFMSLVKSVAGVVNKPLDVSVTITLGGFQSAQQFLDAYTYEDLTIAELEGNSNSMWTISPPSRENLIELLGKDGEFPITMALSVQRYCYSMPTVIYSAFLMVTLKSNLTLGAKAEVASYKHIAYLGNNTKKELLHLLNGTRNEPVSIPHIFPCYIRAPSTSEAKPVSQLYTDNKYKDITLYLNSTSTKDEIQGWWIVNQTDSCHSKPKNRTGLELCVFSDQVSPPSLGFLAGYGIMGLYASVVLVIGKFVREFFSGISHTIMFEELPNVDRILKLCTDIFLVRETGELDLEEDLYAKLIFLYRSPETMIKWTREKSQ